MNICIFTGRLTAKPELKTGQSGNEYTGFSLAVDYLEKNGDKTEKKAHFFRFSAFGKTAAAMCQYCDKGDQITVQAEASVENWEKDGQKHETVKFLANRFDFGAKAKAKTETAEPQAPLNEDDIPF